MKTKFIMVVGIVHIGDGNGVSIHSKSFEGVVENRLEADKEAKRIKKELEDQMGGYASVAVTWVTVI